jgi:hypothetical protein
MTRIPQLAQALEDLANCRLILIFPSDAYSLRAGKGLQPEVLVGAAEGVLQMVIHEVFTDRIDCAISET